MKRMIDPKNLPIPSLYRHTVTLVGNYADANLVFYDTNPNKVTLDDVKEYVRNNTLRDGFCPTYNLGYFVSTGKYDLVVGVKLSDSDKTFVFRIYTNDHNFTTREDSPVHVYDAQQSVVKVF